MFFKKTISTMLLSNQPLAARDVGERNVVETSCLCCCEKYILGLWQSMLIGLCSLLLIPCSLTSCRGDEIIFPAEYEKLPIESRELTSFAPNEPIGMYLLNEGNMGSNKATIDYLDFCNGIYIRNIYGERNPNVIKELGDVGNDIQVYGNRLYAVINCSHKVEVMDLHSCRRIGQIDIPNCRYIRFHGDKAYISSYVGPVSIDPNAQLGAIFEVDTATLRITRQVTVGYQPEEFEIIGNYLYVANSGGYRAPDYDSTLSVVDLTDFRQVKKIPVCVNPHRVCKDQYDRLWITSRGDHKDVQPQLVCFQPLHPTPYTLHHDFVACPDLYPAVALTCERLGIELHATGVESLPLKESDRLRAVAEHRTDADHRMAMALLIAGYEVDDTACIRKSYPQFLEHYRQLKESN